MSEWNSIYDANRMQIGLFRHGVAWSTSPRVRLGEYDYGDKGSIFSNTGETLATFANRQVVTVDGRQLGEYVEVLYSEMSGEIIPELRDSKVKRLDVDGKAVGWCIGNPGSACAAIYFLFSNHEQSDV